MAEELAQDAFLRLYERFDAVDHPPGFLRTAVVRGRTSAAGRRRWTARPRART